MRPSGSPARKACVRTRWSPRSRSPSWNQVSPPERAHGLERPPGLAFAPPTALLVVQPGKRVQDRVEIGRDVEPEHLEVVADVPDHRHVARLGGLDDALHEARTTHAARENDDLHAFTRSASVSTSF